MNPAELKAAQVRLQSLRAEQGELIEQRESIRARQSEIDKSLAVPDKSIASIEERLAAPADPKVSEHALLRYIERRMGVNLEAVTREILSEGNRKAIEFAPSCRIKSNGIDFVVRNGVVVTVV